MHNAKPTTDDGDDDDDGERGRSSREEEASDANEVAKERKGSNGSSASPHVNPVNPVSLMSPVSPASPWQRLLHRWFVEYNPLYLLSAMLVLGGMILSSRGLAHDGSLYGQIGIAAIAELYSVVLIGGAALLMRVGHRRSAVMSALLTVLYQCDLTLHTETCPNLQFIGVLATGVWLALFVAKLYALAWAMKLRISRIAIATATVGALGVALLPYCLQQLDNPRAAGALVVLWLFVVFTMRSVFSGSTTKDRLGLAVGSEADHFGVTSLAELDPWGTTVLRRAVRATWVLWALLLSLHVLFWSTQYRQLDLTTIVPVVPLLLTQWIRGERRVWATVSATLVIVGVNVPGAFSVTAFVVAVALALRALAAARSSGETLQTKTETRTPPPQPVPYRAPPSSATSDPLLVGIAATTTTSVVVDPLASMRRLLVGAVFAIYLSVWTLGWSSGSWPNHILPLDIALSVVLAIGIWRAHGARVLPALPIAAAWTHFVLHARLIPAPRSSLEWGGASIALGFVLLITSLAASYWLRSTQSQTQTQTQTHLQPPNQNPNANPHGVGSVT